MTDVNPASAEKENQEPSRLFDLPLELIIKILERVDPIELAKLERVSRRVRVIVEDNAFWGQFLKEEVYQAIKEGGSVYKNAKAAYIEGSAAIDLNKISLATFLMHPRRAYCSYSGRDISSVRRTIFERHKVNQPTTPQLKQDLNRELQNLVKEKPSITATEGIEIAFQKIDSLRDLDRANTPGFFNIDHIGYIESPPVTHYHIPHFDLPGSLTEDERLVLHRVIKRS